MIDVLVDDHLDEQMAQHLAGSRHGVGFLRCHFDAAAAGFIAKDWRGLSDDELEWRWEDGVQLTEYAQRDVIRWAFASASALVEVHDHGGLRPACFSRTDRESFAEWVPHIRWRLKQPYGALVVADGTHDGLAWIDDGEPRLLRVRGSRTYHGPPTGLSIERLRGEE